MPGVLEQAKRRGQPISDQERLELWSKERNRLLGLIASDPADSDELNGVIRADVRQIEKFMRFYGKKVAESAGASANVYRLHG